MISKEAVLHCLGQFLRICPHKIRKIKKDLRMIGAPEQFPSCQLADTGRKCYCFDQLQIFQSSPPVSCWFLLSFTLRSLRCRRYLPQNFPWIFIELHCFTTQKIVLTAITAGIRNPNIFFFL
jgi:hypothetical protein